MTLEKIFVLFLILLFPALALANEPSQPTEEEFVQQESRVNILEGAADQNERVSVRGMSLREIMIQRLREEHARGRYLDVQENAIAELSDTEIEEIFQRANAKGNEEDDVVFDMFEGDTNETSGQEFTTSGKALSWKGYVQWLLAGALGLVSGTTSWLAKGGFSYEEEDEWAALSEDFDDEIPLFLGGVAEAGTLNEPYCTEPIGEGFVDPAKLYQVIRGFGYNKIAACAILGNIEQESTFNTYANNEGIYIGLCQWQVEREEGETSSRWEDLLEFARVNAGNPYEAATQLNFMYYEATTKWRSEWCTPEEFNKCQTIEEATRYWLEFYEGAIGQETEKRIDNARKFYEQFS